jgi:hypothetical protein
MRLRKSCHLLSTGQTRFGFLRSFSIRSRVTAGPPAASTTPGIAGIEGLSLTIENPSLDKGDLVQTADAAIMSSVPLSTRILPLMVPRVVLSPRDAQSEERAQQAAPVPDLLLLKSVAVATKLYLIIIRSDSICLSTIGVEYGLKQSGRVWNERIHHFLTEQLGFLRTKADPCVYVLRQGSEFIILGIHVDDMLLAHNSNRLCDGIVAKLGAEFEITNLGTPSLLLGMRITRYEETGAITLDQETFTNEILSRFDMVDCKASPVPALPQVHLSRTMCPKSHDEEVEMKSKPFKDLIGSLLWLATNTRPDISQAVGTLCRFTSNPGKLHWTAAKHVLRYLSNTSQLGVRYKHDASNPDLRAYSDSDWANCPDTRRSTTGFASSMTAGRSRGNQSCKSQWAALPLRLSTKLSMIRAEHVFVSVSY